jgi:hypothetical protein
MLTPAPNLADLLVYDRWNLPVNAITVVSCGRNGGQRVPAYAYWLSQHPPPAICHAGTASSSATSRLGGAPNIRAYSRLNCEAFSYQFANLNSHEPTTIVNNVIGIAKTAKVFNVPTILTTVIE